MEEVEFVDDDDTGFSFLRNDAGNAAVLLRDARRNVNDQQADIRPADGFFTAHGRENFYGGVPTGAGAHAGGVDQHVGLAVVQVGDVNGIAGSARHIGDDGAPVPEDGVDQGGFACVGASHYGYLDGKGRFLSVFRFFLQLFFKRSPFLLEKTVQPGG